MLKAMSIEVVAKEKLLMVYQKDVEIKLKNEKIIGAMSELEASIKNQAIQGSTTGMPAGDKKEKNTTTIWKLFKAANVAAVSAFNSFHQCVAFCHRWNDENLFPSMNTVSKVFDDYVFEMVGWERKMMKYGGVMVYIKFDRSFSALTGSMQAGWNIQNMFHERSLNCGWWCRYTYISTGIKIRDENGNLLDLYEDVFKEYYEWWNSFRLHGLPIYCCLSMTWRIHGVWQIWIDGCKSKTIFCHLSLNTKIH